jgi:hypothetical protein
MYARVARWDGADAEALRKSAEEMKARAASGPPEGLRSTGFTLLIDPDNGTSLAIGLFETEADLRAGDELLNAMTPPPSEGNVGRRTSVEMYEVALDIRS